MCSYPAGAEGGPEGTGTVLKRFAYGSTWKDQMTSVTMDGKTRNFTYDANGIVLIAEIQLLIRVIFTGQLSLGIIGIIMADCRLSGNGYALSVAKSVIDKGIVKTVMGDLGQTVPVL